MGFLAQLEKARRRAPMVTVRLPAAVIARIDARTKEGGKSRTDVMREILIQALAAQPKARKPK
jgi:hypothetical protein